MKKRLLVMIIAVLAVLSPLYAKPKEPVTPTEYHLTYLDSIKGYNDFLLDLNSREDTDRLVSEFDTLVDVIDSMDLEMWEKDMAVTNIAMGLSSHFSTLEEKDRENAQKYLDLAMERLEKSYEEGCPKQLYAIYEALSYSYDYLITGSLSSGMKFTKLVDKAYDKWPQDFSVALFQSSRYIHSPAIGGGNWKKGLKILEKVYYASSTVALHRADIFTLYSNFAHAYEKAGLDDTAKSFADLGLSIYPKDENLNSLVKKIAK